MSANLTPEYKSAEAEYRQASDPQAKLACLEKMLSVVPKHKGTEKLQADLKRRISRLRESLQQRSGKKGFSVKVEREGAAQLALVGAPNSGKSALVEATTNAKTRIADYPFSTQSPVPGMLPFENVQLQLIDLPPVSRDHMEPWVTDLIRVADAAIWVVDPTDPDWTTQADVVDTLLRERKIELCAPEVPLSPPGDPLRRIHTLVVATKADEQDAGSRVDAIRERFAPMPLLTLSALADSDFTTLGRALFDLCGLVRVYSKSPGKDANLDKPFVLHRGDRVIDFARAVHKDFADKLQFAKVWGEGKFDGQRIQRDNELADGDIIELHI